MDLITIKKKAKQDGEGSQNKQEDIEGQNYYRWQRTPRQVPSRNQEHPPLKNKLQLIEATRKWISTRAADVETVENQTNQRPNTIELKLYSLLPRKSEETHQLDTNERHNLASPKLHT